MRSVTTDNTTPQPVSLEEVKDQLGFAQGDSYSDDRLNRLIVAATEQWEHDTQSVTTTRNVTEKIAAFPVPTWRLYYRPVQSFTSIQYYDADGALQTLATSVYSVDIPNRQIHLAPDQDWPTIQARWDAIQIDYVAGVNVVPEIAKQAILVQCDIMEELRGTTKEKNATIKLYENLVARFCRSSYP